MDFSKVPLLTPYNYHEWNQAVSNQLMSIGLFRMILGQDLEPATGVAERRKWFDRRDKALGTLISTISNDFLYHIASWTHPHDARRTLEGIFGKPDRIRKLKLENELIGLSPCDFDNIQDFFLKFNSIRLELSNCGITKDDEQLILPILSELGHEYSIFVSTFYATMDALGSAYKMPSLDEFLAQLTRE